MKYKIGDKVIYSQGTEIGFVGTVMGNKGTSIAVAIDGYDSHDCDGLCPDNNGLFSSEFELEPYTFDGAMNALGNLRRFYDSLEEHVSAADKEIRTLESKVGRLRELNGI